MTEQTAALDAVPIETRYAYGDPRYRAPDHRDVRAAMRAAALTSSTFGKRIGVNSRTVRRWTADAREGGVRIPYAAWRLLLMDLGVAID